MAIKYDIDRDVFDSAEEEMARAINEAGAQEGNGTIAKTALGIGASYLLYRRFMHRRLKEEIPKRNITTADAVGELAIRIFSAYMKSWIPTLAVNLSLGYAAGLKDARAGSNSAWAKASAERYAVTLGSNVNDVSVQALVDGIRAQVNRGVPARMAIDRAIDAFGVAPRTMKTLVNLWTKTPEKITSERPQKYSVKDQIDARISKSIMTRAKTIGDTESRMTRNASKAMYWAYQSENGDLPPTAEKEWITADDERTCPICAPLHHQRVLVTERFDSSIGKLLAPGVHPNCRCELKLHLNLDLTDLMSSAPERELVGKSAWGIVHKARGDDQYARDEDGQFAAQESRGPGTEKRKARFKVYGQNLVAQAQQQKPREEARAVQITPVVKPIQIKPAIQPAVKPKEQPKPVQQVRSNDVKSQSALSPKRLEQVKVAMQPMLMRQADIAQTLEKERAEVETAFQYAHLVSRFSSIDFADLDNEGELERAIENAHQQNVDDIAYESDDIFEMFQGTMADGQSAYDSGWEDPDEMYNADDEVYGDEEPSSDYLDRAGEIDPDRVRVRDLNSKEMYRIADSNGSNLFLDKEDFQNLAISAYLQVDDTITVPAGPSGHGYIADDTVTLKSSELLEKMGSAGEELKIMAVGHRFAIVSSREDREFDEEDDITKLIQLDINTQVKDPFNVRDERGNVLTDKDGIPVGWEYNTYEDHS